MDYQSILGDAYSPERETALNKAIGKEFIPLDRFNEVNETKKVLATTVAERDTQITELSKVDAASLQTKIAELTEQNKTAQAEYESNLANIKRDTVIDNGFKDAGVLSVKAAKALLEDDLKALKLDGDNMPGLAEIIKSHKEKDAWLYTAESGTTGMEHGNAGEQMSGVESEFYKLNPDIKK